MDTSTGQEISDALGVLLKRSTRTQLYRTLTAGVGEAVDELTYPVLSGLARTGPRSAADLAPDIGLDRSGITRRATQLESAGLLRREPDPHDRRATLLALTDKGEQTVKALRQRLSDHIEASLASWPPGEAATFARHLHRFVTDGPFT
ncbi:MarR family winged helix-turn-helix transcriptional regulator [Streptomyces sp. WM6378]|uniref:MarR family winged helix-turn-helix transcriptional regulator n=1 Tax=Streptomyces sp. WM6378 TaxID=1415557 RepID=UPI0006AE78C2|nr:MarR family transcriptional regulator [Streptomyces sp. WM6378]KOU39630.1 MarR family transcriptional regulator [Streptomyces sp. WM6378]